jgi:transcriptional regulator with XRE-family HTH domain
MPTCSAMRRSRSNAMLPAPPCSLLAYLKGCRLESLFLSDVPAVVNPGSEIEDGRMAESDLSEMPDSVMALLPRLRGRRGEPGFISAEGLAWEVGQRLGRRVSTSYIQQIEWGRSPPSAEVLEAIAQHFDVDPSLFAEYRLARARELLDDRAVGLAAAVENYELLAEAAPGLRVATDRIAAVADADAAAGEVIARLREARERVLADQGSSADAAPPPRPARPRRGPRRRARRPRQAAG